MIKKAIVGLLIIAVLIAVYIYLGGTSDVEVKKIAKNNYLVAGIEYKGRYRDTALEDTYFYVKNTLEQSDIQGTLVVINYTLEPDSTDKGFINQFLGIELSDTNTNLPQKFELRKLNAKEVVQATIKAHNLVMPSPDAIENEINAFAREQNLKLVNFTIEKYRSERNLIVEVPVVDYYGQETEQD